MPNLLFAGLFVGAVTYSVVDIIRHVEARLDRQETRRIATRIGERRMMARRASDRVGAR